MCILNFLNDYNGALMVVITAVYVIATIKICKANIQSATATHEQVAESKRQFEETKRLEIMPYLQFESQGQGAGPKLRLVLVSGDINGGTYILSLKIKNIGHGAAKDITYVWSGFSQSYPECPFPVRAIQGEEEQYITIDFAMPQNKANSPEASFVFSYKDLLEHIYRQKLVLSFSYAQNQLRLTDLTVNPPQFVEEEKTNAQ